MSLVLHPLVHSHAVLQRQRPIPIYGRAEPGADVSVELAGQKASTKAQADGGFWVELPALSAGGPHTLTVKSQGETVTSEDILIGDVWLLSGQSNMEWSVSQSDGADEELARVEDPELRLFRVPQIESQKPELVPPATWTRSDPAELSRASAVGVFFARRMRRELGVPTGLVMSYWGGTRIAAWIPKDALEKQDHIGGIARRAGDHIVYEMVFHKDPGNEGEARGYARPDFDDSSWGTMVVPSMWQDHGEEYNGAVWFRLTLDVPAAMADGDGWLDLGTIDDFDVSYVNGERVGATGPEVLNAYGVTRHYRVKRGLLKPGKNVIAIRVFDHFGFGGIQGGTPLMRLYREGHERDGLRLAGPWRFCAEHKLLPWYVFTGAVTTSGPYNAMIHPLQGSAYRGVLFYQGESDVTRAEHYRVLFQLMIETWRKRLRDPELPFLFVQLANYMAEPIQPGDDDWAELRESQTKALALPQTAMAVAIDVGDQADIHPRDKKSVGERLALGALAKIFKKDIVYSGPMFRSAQREGKSIVVAFDHATGLVSKHEKVRGFSIAGSDGRFEWADAVIEGETVRISSSHVPEPVAVRYGWSSNPTASLVNDAGLPASPFRTDDFALMTKGIR